MARLGEVLDQTTKRHVMRPLCRQVPEVPEVLARCRSETLGLSGFRLRGLFGTRPLARTLGRPIDREPGLARMRYCGPLPSGVTIR